MIFSPSPDTIGWLGSMTQRISCSPSSRHFSMPEFVPQSFWKIFEAWPECKTIRPMPSSTRRYTRSTISSATRSCAMCPHQISTSVSSSTACVSPCSGSSSVAVLTAMPAACRKSAMHLWMPLG